MGPHDFAEASCEGPKSIQASSQPPAGATLSGQDATFTTCTSCVSASRRFLAYMFFSGHSFKASVVCWHSHSSAVSTTTDLFGWTNDWNVDKLMEGSPSGVSLFSQDFAVEIPAYCVTIAMQYPQETINPSDDFTKAPSLILPSCRARRTMGLSDGSNVSLQASSRTIRVGESVGEKFSVPHVSFVIGIVSKTELIISPNDRGKDTKYDG